MLGYAGVASIRWLELADVVTCPAGTWPWAVLARLPGCAVAAAAWGRLCVMAVRGGGGLVAADGCVATHVVRCYASLVSGELSRASSLARTCCARGMRERR